jgi:hypothetical protein
VRLGKNRKYIEKSSKGARLPAFYYLKMEIARKTFLSGVSSSGGGGRVWVQGTVLERNVCDKQFRLDDGSALASVSWSGDVPVVGKYVSMYGCEYAYLCVCVFVNMCLNSDERRVGDSDP